MVHIYFLILSLIFGTACAEIQIFDEPKPWTPLKKEHALFYSAVWGSISAGLLHGTYLLAKTLKKPIDSNAIMNDAVCLVAIGIVAKLAHYSAYEAYEGLQLYLNDKEDAVI